MQEQGAYYRLLGRSKCKRRPLIPIVGRGGRYHGVTKGIARHLRPQRGGSRDFCGFWDPKWQFSKSPHIPIYEVGVYQVQGVCNQTAPQGWGILWVLKTHIQSPDISSRRGRWSFTLTPALTLNLVLFMPYCWQVRYLQWACTQVAGVGTCVCVCGGWQREHDEICVAAVYRSCGRSSLIIK